MEQLGLIIFASLFVLSGINHIRNHAATSGYLKAALGKCPLAAGSYIGGWPVGVFLIVFGVGAAFNNTALYANGLAVFLALVTVIFHRDFLKDPSGFKGLSLLGAALYIASQVG